MLINFGLKIPLCAEYYAFNSLNSYPSITGWINDCPELTSLTDAMTAKQCHLMFILCNTGNIPHFYNFLSLNIPDDFKITNFTTTMT